MRIAAIVASMCWLVAGCTPSTAAPTEAHVAPGIPPADPCPISDFRLLYGDTESVELSHDQLETVDAAVARARECDVQSIELFSNSTAPDQGLWQRRVEAVRQALIARGIDAKLIDVRLPNSEMPDWATFANGAAVVALIHFR